MMATTGEKVVKVGSWWWEGTGPVWTVDVIEDRAGMPSVLADDTAGPQEGATAVLARWRRTERELERVEQRVGVEALIQDQPWRLAPLDEVERQMQGVGLQRWQWHFEG